MSPIRLLRQSCRLALLLACAGAATTAGASELRGDGSVSGYSAAGIGSGYTAEGASIGAPTALQIDLRGEVSARCRMTTPPALAGTVDLNRGGTTHAQFGLDCNTPFLFSVRSSAGGFASQGMAEGVAKLVPYELSVDIDTDAGTNALGWCASIQLAANGDAGCPFGASGWSSGDATAIDRSGAISLRWMAPAEGDRPALGTYGDTIVVDITVRS